MERIWFNLGKADTDSLLTSFIFPDRQAVALEPTFPPKSVQETQQRDDIQRPVPTARVDRTRQSAAPALGRRPDPIHRLRHSRISARGESTVQTR